jgi:hypothetical protein
MKSKISKENSFLYKSISEFSTFIYTHCDRISVKSRLFIEYSNKRHYIPMRLMTYIHQHAEKTYLSISSPIDNGITDFVFLGNIGISQHIDCIINAVEEIQTNLEFMVHILGGVISRKL